MPVSRNEGRVRLIVAEQAYDCAGCQNMNGTWSSDERAHRWCTRTDHGRPAWRGAKPRGFRAQLGQRRGGDWIREDLSVTGCPAGYQVSAFAESVSRYARLTDRSNRLYDRLDDALIIEAVHLFERHVEGCRSLFEHARLTGG